MEFVASRSLANLCIHKNTKLISSSEIIDDTLFDGLKEGDSVYICNTAIKYFVNWFLPKLNCKIVLVSGDSDDLIYKNVIINKIINSPMIHHWYIQNCQFEHRKVTVLPVGLDYHTIASGQKNEWGAKQSETDQERDLQTLRETMKPIEQRKPLCYANYHFTINRGDRTLAYKNVPKKLCYYEPALTSRINNWKNQLDYAFVISPFGCGFDCHRTWEALLLGCIPITRHSTMDKLFEDLPVLLVNKWSDVTRELLDDYLAKYKNKIYNYNKLTLKYWDRKINTMMDKFDEKEIQSLESD
jgi:hypothetical protein